MPEARDREEYQLFPDGVSRLYYKSQNGWNGDHHTVYAYATLMARSFGVQYWADDTNGVYTDAPNVSIAHQYRASGGFPPPSQIAVSRARGRLREKVSGTSAELGAVFGEWKQSLGMIRSRAYGLYNAYRHLTRGNFRGFLNALSVNPKRKHRNKLRNAAEEASGLWLEYWFGWAPLTSDIFNAMTECGQGIPGSDERSSAGFAMNVQSSYGYYEEEATGTGRIRMGATFNLSNPNQFLLAQLGLVNPVSVLWELTPFSFFVDWCFGVGSWIDSFSDFAGLSVENGYTSSVLVFRGKDRYLPTGPDAWSPGFRTHRGYAAYRAEGLVQPIPNMEIKANLGQSLTRAASAVSLLTQILSGGISSTRK